MAPSQAELRRRDRQRCLLFLISKMQDVLTSYDLRITLDGVVSKFKAIGNQSKAPFPKLDDGHDPFDHQYHRLFAFFFQLAHLEVDDEQSLTVRKFQTHIKKQKARAHPDRMCLQSNCSCPGWAAKCATVMGALDKATEHLEHYIVGRTYYSEYWMHK